MFAGIYPGVWGHWSVCVRRPQDLKAVTCLWLEWPMCDENVSSLICLWLREPGCEVSCLFVGVCLSGWGPRSLFGCVSHGIRSLICLGVYLPGCEVYDFFVIVCPRTWGLWLFECMRSLTWVHIKHLGVRPLISLWIYFLEFDIGIANLLQVWCPMMCFSDLFEGVSSRPQCTSKHGRSLHWGRVYVRWGKASYLFAGIFLGSAISPLYGMVCPNLRGPCFISECVSWYVSSLSLWRCLLQDLSSLVYVAGMSQLVRLQIFSWVCITKRGSLICLCVFVKGVRCDLVVCICPRMERLQLFADVCTKLCELFMGVCPRM